ncbi:MULTISPECIES: pyrroloquinoline quinone biosynthesis protein PqqB [unclassified Saccharibacter]|uniref:pyrroloquinoline quinone biosynthesis protein PqqB n=1 Tax=unclassified Saccharibacter TaxID=2648722 RepID=UPI001326FD9C|nr:MULTISPECIES: pyrroloquinoline quinone biosynthesis protein PqqB [unclassified Saccharibacter]MXV36471.1 pyrroloquinoline quinone biosynthesis protein PqqB [Saccharibacter sp. EH611]MXV57633.1 pyrroloquinoline quinone biosynthesis protein PqqB [Saccharibacter sp. EH70]MXV65060.1 pyrroloquinoline quinone biosynthesis protein PqqB [Saccharibacter sp. EH60]
MLDVIVLGAGAGGGFPQWNSAAPACLKARSGHGAKPRTQASLAISGDNTHWFLLNASPDLRQQILTTPALQHHGSPRGTPIQGVILTGAEIDTTVGLFTMREREPFTLYASRSSLAQLDANPMFEALDREIVTRSPLPLHHVFSLPLKDGQPSGLTLEAFPVPGKAPLYAEKDGTKEDDSLGLSISDGQRTLLYIPGCASITPELLERAQAADLLFFDGTLWDDDEMIRAGLSPKTGHRMGHVSVNGDDGPLKHFAACSKPRKMFIHINNSNPILLEDSPERHAVEKAGWTVAEDGMTFQLEAL